MKLEIVTPEGIAYSGEVEMVTLTGVAGEMGILPGHARLMTPLRPGELVARKDGQDELLAVGEGLVEITRDRVSVLTDMAVSASSLDDARTQEALRRAEARLQQRLSAEEIASTNAALARTLAQLRLRRRR